MQSSWFVGDGGPPRHPHPLKMTGGMVALLFLCLFALNASAQEMTVSFDLSAEHPAQAFRQLLDDVRARLRVPGQPLLLDNAGRLPQQEDVPTRFMDLVLRTAEHGITLRLRMDNLYVLGFRNGIDQGTWFEFRDDNRNPGRLITDSTPLGFGGGYRGDGLGSIDESTQLGGRPDVEVAIEMLATHGNGATVDDNTLKTYLRALILHFVESMRFTEVAQQVAGLLADGEEASGSQANVPGPMGTWLAFLVRHWGDLSTLLLVAANDAVQDPQVLAQRFRDFATENFGYGGINTALEAAQALGLVLLTNSHARSLRPRRSVEDNADHVPAGITLVEIIAVTVPRIDDEDPGNLYGSISVDDGFGSQQLLYTGSFHAQSVGPGGLVKLTGPGRGISGSDGFVIDFNLWDFDLNLSYDDEVSKGAVVWNSLMATSDQYDEVQSRTIDGANGQVEISFAVVTDAAIATVEIVILDSSEDSPNVYGVIQAGTTLKRRHGLSRPFTTLLDLEDDQSVSVAKGSAVPLETKVVVVQMNTVMLLEATLMDRNLIFAKEQIAKGSVEFKPRLTGEDTAELTGKKGRVMVRITWSTWFH
ncbi:hypothetical protein ACQJBY_017991 [Aegilops geniculata]